MMKFYFIGVKGVQVEELWSLDAEQFENLKYVCLSIYLCFEDNQLCRAFETFFIFVMLCLFLYADLSMV
jgi:hypothetical protein